MNSPFIQVTHKTHVNDFSLSTRQRTNCTVTRQKVAACANVPPKQGLSAEGTARTNLLDLQGIVSLCILLLCLCKVPFQLSPKQIEKLRFFSGLVF